MSVIKESFGTTKDGIPVERYRLKGTGGLEACMLTYGATLQALYFEGKDLVLGYDTLADYENQNGSYQGATIGRYANRIADGKFTLNGKEYVLCCNETGRGHLHGGAVGFDKKVWKAEVLSAELAPAVRFYLVSPDGDEGYPGRLEVALTVTVGDENVLHFEYMARSDADTVVNLTNHSYFNLNGADGSDVLDTLLHLNADYITPVDQQLIPDGSMLAVEGTPFDFRTPKAIGQDIAASHPQLALGGGYDHNYMLSQAPDGEFLRYAAAAVSPRTGIRMYCYTDQPAVQFYTANGLNETAGKYAVPLHKHQGFCLETQHVPNSPNQPEFPTTVLKAGKVLRTETAYRFDKI